MADVEGLTVVTHDRKAKRHLDELCVLDDHTEFVQAINRLDRRTGRWCRKTAKGLSARSALECVGYKARCRDYG